jgi:ribosome modulation factor
MGVQATVLGIAQRSEQASPLGRLASRSEHLGGQAYLLQDRLPTLCHRRRDKGLVLLGQLLEARRLGPLGGHGLELGVADIA